MQHAAHQESGRREERVPLEAFVELHSEGSGEPLSADGINVSNGGIAMRAAFVPPQGALLECRFACPPSGELVSALGEVAWSERTSPDEAQFGLRFLELDTKSATTLRRYVEPDEGPYAPKDQLRAASLKIDGLGPAVDAELKLADEARVVLEQQLTFLQLGRGVEVSVLGRGKERGRIASVELRQTHFDVPTLVFGILLDEAPERAVEAVAAGVAPLFSGAGSPVESPRHVWAREVGSGEPVYAVEVSGASARIGGHVSAAVVEARGPARERSDVEARGPARERSDAAARGLARERSDVEARQRDDELELPTWGARLRRTVAPLKTAGQAALRGLGAFRRGLARRARARAEELELPDAKTRLLLHVARGRALLLRAWSRLRRAPGRRGRARQPPPLRVQRSTMSGAPPAVQSQGRRARLAVAVLATAGLGVAGYALAPRTEADRLPTREPLAQDALIEGAGEDGARLEPAQDHRDPAVAPSEDAPRGARIATFGEPEVPNGRTFTLRMNGPVRSVEGHEREDGFTVRIPRRVSLDRASPIASAHSAVARAMILNRSGYAELTIDFVPGVKPRYQVIAKDNTLEVTLERL